MQAPQENPHRRPLPGFARTVSYIGLDGAHPIVRDSTGHRYRLTLPADTSTPARLRALDDILTHADEMTLHHRPATMPALALALAQDPSPLTADLWIDTDETISDRLAAIFAED